MLKISMGAQNKKTTNFNLEQISFKSTKQF